MTAGRGAPGGRRLVRRAAARAAPALVLVGWARVRLHAHTLAQVIAGAAAGALIAGLMLATPAWPG